MGTNTNTKTKPAVMSLAVDGFSASAAKKLNAEIQFELSANGKKQSWVLDAKSGSPGVKLGPVKKAKMTLVMTDENFVKLAQGKLNAQQAFMQGKMKIKGSMALAQKLGPMLASAKAKM